MGKFNGLHEENIFFQLTKSVDNNLPNQLITLNFIKINLNELKLIYRAEGNANLVLSLPDTRQVLRLRKTLKHQNNETEDSLTLKELEEYIEYTKCVSSIIGKFLTCEPQLVQLEINNLDNFNDWLLKFRPADRLNKEIRCCYGTLYPDVAFLPPRLMSLRTSSQATTNNKKIDTFCVEIKPKQGWTFYETNDNDDIEPSYNFIYNRCLKTELRKCRYCCMQYLKLETGAIHQKSRYCPIDLFSGDQIRMRHAIAGLFDSPQNNLRVFKNEILIYGDKLDNNTLAITLEELFGIESTHKERMKLFINLIISILLNDITINKPYNYLDDNDELSNVDQRICKVIDYNRLPSKTALRQILDIQLLAKSSLNEILIFDDTESTSTYIDNILKKYLLENCGSDNTKEFLETLNKYEKYLVGATALDCSLMLSFQQINDLEYYSNYDIELTKYTIILNDLKFLSNITIMDLDPKSTKHYSKYIRQTNLSHMAYKRFLISNAHY